MVFQHFINGEHQFRKLNLTSVNTILLLKYSKLKINPWITGFTKDKNKIIL